VLERHSTLAVAVALGLAYAAQLVRFRAASLPHCNNLEGTSADP